MSEATPYKDGASGSVYRGRRGRRPSVREGKQEQEQHHQHQQKQQEEEDGDEEGDKEEDIGSGVAVCIGMYGWGDILRGAAPNGWQSQGLFGQACTKTS